MFQLVHAPAPSPSLVRLRDAIGHCRAAGIAVRIGEIGVVRALEGRLTWELAGPLVVDPIGAALIAWQPAAMATDDAAALALECDADALTGIRHGLESRRPCVAGWSYSDGYCIGLQLRADLLAPAGALRVVA